MYVHYIIIPINIYITCYPLFVGYFLLLTFTSSSLVRKKNPQASIPLDHLEFTHLGPIYAQRCLSSVIKRELLY